MELILHFSFIKTTCNYLCVLLTSGNNVCPIVQKINLVHVQQFNEQKKKKFKIHFSYFH